MKHAPPVCKELRFISEGGELHFGRLTANTSLTQIRPDSRIFRAKNSHREGLATNRPERQTGHKRIRAATWMKAPSSLALLRDRAASPESPQSPP
jgi:hypothetical protein